MSESHYFSKSRKDKPAQPDEFSVDDSKRMVSKFDFISLKILNVQNILIALALICILFLFRNLVEPGFLVAMCLFAGTFLMPVFSKTLRDDEDVLFGYWFVVFLHHGIAFTNYYFFSTVGAGSDANDFQIRIVAFSKAGEWGFVMGAELYVQILGMIYRWFGPSPLLGGELSIFAFALSCIVLVKLMQLLGIVKYRVYSLLAYGALPTMLLFGSITLRESYQVLFFMVAVYFGIKMHTKGGINGYIFAFIFSAILMGITHRGLIGYAMFMIPIFFIWTLHPVSRRGNIKKMRLAAIVIGPIVVLSLLVLTTKFSGMGRYAELTNKNWLEVISQTRLGPIRTPGRTTYGVPFDLSSNIMTLYTGIKLYVYYLFAPLPWHVHGLQDAYASIESFLRMALIYFSLKHWWGAVGKQKRLFGLMLILYFSVTFLFALGTTNYGTAMRHHMLDWWIIVIIGIPAFMTKLSSFRFRRPNTN
jgi:hypothetical protein